MDAMRLVIPRIGVFRIGVGVVALSHPPKMGENPSEPGKLQNGYKSMGPC